MIIFLSQLKTISMGVVIMKINILFLLFCAEQLSSSHQAKVKPRKNVDVYLELMEKTYTSSYEGNPSDGENCGEPLLLTPLIEQNKIAEARKAASVDPTNFLPGIESYAGYLTVDKKYNGNLFFWYFPVLQKPVERTPWILWLQGGPGASSMYGLFEEIGPYSVTEDFKIKERQYSWAKNHSILFIDNPVGTGFSFTDDEGYCTNQTTIGENLYTALQQFLKIFPELRQAPLIIAGESYAGKHIPSLGIQIHWNKEKGEPINLQGLAIGNGFIDPVSLQKFSYVAREIGILDDKTADVLKEMEEDTVISIKDKELQNAYYDQNAAYIVLILRSYLPNPYNFLANEQDIFGSYVKFIQRPEIRRALHVGNSSFTNIGKVYHKLQSDMMNSAKKWLEELLDHYRVMVYNGHLDTVVAYHPSVNTYNSLSFSGASEYKEAEREPWTVNDQLAGYYKRGGNFLDVMVRGAGHMVPVDQPMAALRLITTFALNEPLQDDSDEPPILYS